MLGLFLLNLNIQLRRRCHWGMAILAPRSCRIDSLLNSFGCIFVGSYRASVFT